MFAVNMNQSKENGGSVLILHALVLITINRTALLCFIESRVRPQMRV